MNPNYDISKFQLPKIGAKGCLANKGSNHTQLRPNNPEE